MKEGKVVKILNPHELVINLGTAEGVTEDEDFVVYALGEEIIDPDSGESLGTLEIVRGKGFAKHVQEHMSTLRSKETRTEISDRLRPRLDPVEQEWFEQAGTLADTVEYVTGPVRVDAPFDQPKKGDLVRAI